MGQAPVVLHILFATLLHVLGASLALATKPRRPDMSPAWLTLSRRVQETEPAHIEEVLSKYSGLADEPSNLAQGVAHWSPPPAALEVCCGQFTDKECEAQLASPGTHRYGPALGLPELRDALVRKLEKENGLNMHGQQVMVTAGGNQAFAMVALALLDPGDRALLVKPFYCAHLCAVQLAGAEVVGCEWDPQTLLPDMANLRKELERGVKMVVVTTPGNPSGAVYPQAVMDEIVSLCRNYEAWLVVDEAYEHFLFDGSRHYSPCANNLGHPGLIHLFSMSKSFGLAGWRVGYAVYPDWAGADLVKIQDTLPTHAPIASQKVALAALEGTGGGSAWSISKAASLSRCREEAWAAVRAMGGVKGTGAFYYLVPLPEGVGEDAAIDCLAREWKVLVTPGRAFGAPGHIRISYGSLPEQECLAAIDRLRKGLASLAGDTHG
ncbi:unnamed protein product [Discosporangium mesarthrocarpum]